MMSIIVGDAGVCSVFLLIFIVGSMNAIMAELSRHTLTTFTMARYTGLFKVAVLVNNLQQGLSDTLEACNFEVIYQSGDYLMARERPGQVSFQQLVTVEILVDKTKAMDQEFQMNMVIKNEELPLQVDNHCRQVFSKVSQAMLDTQHWTLIESVAG
jgi:hypothetical protein